MLVYVALQKVMVTHRHQTRPKLFVQLDHIQSY